MSLSNDEQLTQKFREKWPEALAAWSKFTKLSEPRWCFSDADEKREKLAGSFAMIRLDDQAVVIGMRGVERYKLEDYAVEILAHEIGHHVYCPGDLTDQGRMLARMRKALPTVEDEAPFIANLYADLLINDKLKRSANLRMDAIYRAIGDDGTSNMWTLYMRIYELLWGLPQKTLAKGRVTNVLEGDAQLGARVIRAYSKDWLRGSGRFAALLLPYLAENAQASMKRVMRGFTDGMHESSADASPQGLTEVEDDEADGAIHPANDPFLSGEADRPGDHHPGDNESANAAPTDGGGNKGSRGQYREPFEYGAILKNLGMNLTEDEVAIRYYKERSAPHLVRFPVQKMPESTEPLAEGIEPWDIGAPLENIDWLQSLLVSPQIIPSMTTVQRVWGNSQGNQPRTEPIDLDIYIDSSGSMPNPKVTVSYLALAGAIIALSALRTGARVQATLWSGAGQFISTNEFSSDEHKILKIITGFLSGATAFPIHILRDTFSNRKKSDRPVHILVISDDGADTMFDKDEQGNSGWNISQMALQNGRAGGSLVLNLYDDWRKRDAFVKAAQLGYDIYSVQTWDQLEQFARAFSAKKYGQPGR